MFNLSYQHFANAYRRFERQDKDALFANLGWPAQDGAAARAGAGWPTGKPWHTQMTSRNAGQGQPLGS